MSLRRILCLILFLSGFNFAGFSQNHDTVVIRNFFTEALSNPVACNNLNILCKNFSGRLCGSGQAARAVDWTYHLLRGMEPDTVYLQPVKVKRWVRGDKEIARVTAPGAPVRELSICALGSSIGTGASGITAEVVEVHGFDELQALGRRNIEGKIVFYNRPANPSHIYTFDAYGGAVKQRAWGAMNAARFGAVAVIVRSASLKHDDIPHTGIQHYADSVVAIPAVSVSTNGADSLSGWLKADPGLKLFVRTTCEELAEVDSYNVIAEIRGSEHPGRIIAFGGHIDAWDLGEGAHDDGVGVVQTIEVLRLFRQQGIRPNNTLRLIVFMDEEYAQRGGNAYADWVTQRGEPHLAAIESDRGGFTPQGFSIQATEKQAERIMSLAASLKPYGFWSLKRGGSGVDIEPLRHLGFPLIALVTDSQRYFDYQHSASDTFDKVHPRELQLGSAGLASLIYMIDKYEP